MNDNIKEECLCLIYKYAHEPSTMLNPNSVFMITGNRVNEFNFRKALKLGFHQLTKLGFNTNPSNFYGELSEPFIEYFEESLDWLWVSSDSILSEAFVEKHMDKLNWRNMLNNQVFSESFLEKHIFKWGGDKQNWVNLSHNFKSEFAVSPDFYLRHLDKIDESLLLDDYTYKRMFRNMILAKREELLKKVGVE